MKNITSELVKIIELYAPKDGFNPSPIDGTHCIKLSHTDSRSKRHWRASICIVVQGCKEIILGREAYRYTGAHYIAIPIDLPVSSRVIEASECKPLLCIKIDFDPLTLSEVANQIEKEFPNEIENSLRGIFMGKATEPMLEASLRLAKLFQSPDDARVLGPLVIKEIIYHLLKGPDGPAIRQFVRSGSKMHQVSQAIFTLKSDLDRDVDVSKLAKSVNMSRSAFFKHFKEVTAMSPIQYQKRLRLLEARRLMIDEGETAEGSAFKVGYNSASQFSREYSRMFGNPPVRDAVKTKKTGLSVVAV